MYLRLNRPISLIGNNKWRAHFYSIQSTCQHTLGKEQEVQSFKDIPGPTSLPIIGTLYKYLPLIGEFSFTKLHESGAIKLARYGPLVREEMVPGLSVVWIFRPEDIAEVFRAETGLYPERRSHLALLKYREDRKNIYNTGGLLPTNGSDWWRIRREFQKVLSKPQNVVDYLEDTDIVIREFIQLCSREQFDDFLPLLSRLFLELTCLVAFDVRMNSFSDVERLKNSRTSKLIDAALTTNSAILKLDNGPRLWRYFETPLYRKMRKAQNYMEKVAVEMVYRQTRDTTIHRKESLLEKYLKNPALDAKDVVGMACDMLLAGIDTTTYSTSFALYHIANNPLVQEKLKREVATLITDSNSSITSDTLKNASYTKAVIKETFRMNPISVGVGRILQTDVILSGYFVPKGTVVVTQNEVTCRLPEYFDNPNTFIPERWLRSDSGAEKSKPIHPYLVLPFGHGSRSCIARRFAEQSMQTFLLRMFQGFHLTWCGKKLMSKSLLINKPDVPIKIVMHNDRGDMKHSKQSLIKKKTM